MTLQNVTTMFVVSWIPKLILRLTYSLNSQNKLQLACPALWCFDYDYHIFKRIHLKVKNIVICLSFLLDSNINYCVVDFFSSVLFAFVPVFELRQIERTKSEYY